VRKFVISSSTKYHGKKLRTTFLYESLIIDELFSNSFLCTGRCQDSLEDFTTDRYLETFPNCFENFGDKQKHKLKISNFFLSSAFFFSRFWPYPELRLEFLAAAAAAIGAATAAEPQPQAFDPDWYPY
jgi:hypothetical protein